MRVLFRCIYFIISNASYLFHKHIESFDPSSFDTDLKNCELISMETTAIVNLLLYLIL